MNPSPSGGEPASFAAAAAALNAIDEAVRAARRPGPHPAEGGQANSEQAVAALLLLRELRDQLAGWEPGLIEAARAAGASWADLAHPLGVASRQAAERRYLRVRPGAPGTTGEQRVQATRNHRAADRTVTTWARENAADLRQLAGQITALTDLPGTSTARLAAALADNEAVSLIAPLTDTRQHLTADHPDLAARVDTVTRRTDRLRQDSDGRRTS
ncbi:type III effector protein [Streptomyces sp. NBC_01166]|uniref:type III effector protein n=1 Tax=unclassified Streptomyces TaxID=2593676 RepID=UPI003723BE36|nr:type III effector protein [Streptomyces sp. NBC_01166]